MYSIYNSVIKYNFLNILFKFLVLSHILKSSLFSIIAIK